MRIQIQSSYYFPHLGGAQNIMGRLAAELQSAGHYVEVLCQPSPNQPARGMWDGVPVVRHPYTAPTDARWMIELLLKPRVLRQEVPKFVKDIDIIWTLDEAYSLASAQAVPGTPVVYIAMHNSRTMLLRTREAPTWRDRVIRGLEALQRHSLQKRGLRRATQIVVWCEITRRDMSATFGIPREHIEVVPLGPGPAFPSAGIDAEVLRREWGIPIEAPVILCVCRLDANKNVPHLVRALAACRNQSAVLLVVGDGRQRSAIEALATELGVRDRVRLVGAQRNPAPFYAMADIFAFPSIFEGFGMVLLEAMQQGLPCVALKADYPRVVTSSEEVIRDGDTGFVVNPYSVEEFASRLDMLCHDPGLRRRLGHAGRQRCEEAFRWDTHVSRLLELSRSLVDRPAARVA